MPLEEFEEDNNCSDYGSEFSIVEKNSGGWLSDLCDEVDDTDCCTCMVM